jgi:hypothetical protein
MGAQDENHIPRGTKSSSPKPSTLAFEAINNRHNCGYERRHGRPFAQHEGLFKVTIMVQCVKTRADSPNVAMKAIGTLYCNSL